MKKSMAFLSYATLDDEHNNGWVTRFRNLLSTEIEAQTGEKFEIFQYKDSIGWGENWYDRIMNDIDRNAVFLITIISPKFFASEYCRKELEQFLLVEKKSQRSDMILPIHFTGPQSLETIDDPLAQVIAQRTCVDWRRFRHVSLECV